MARVLVDAEVEEINNCLDQIDTAIFELGPYVDKSKLWALNGIAEALVDLMGIMEVTGKP